MVSTLSGPIPPDPYYDKTNPRDRLDIPIGKTRPEAAAYATQGQQGTVGMLLELTGRSFSAQSTSTKVMRKQEPRDHVTENVHRMRRIQRENKKRQDMTSQPVKGLWKSTKYDSVSSKVREKLETESPTPSRPSSANYLRAHSRTGWVPTSRSRPTSAEPPEEKLSVPKADTAREVKLKRNDVDFIKANGFSVKHSGMRRSPSLTMLDDLKKKREDEEKNYQRGIVPQYLVSRQKKWEKEEIDRKNSIPDPDMPAGHRIMPKQEQNETLQKLKDSQKELLRQISSLPIRTDTLTLQNRKGNLDKKLAEVEEAIKIFSRPKVFVKLDS